MGEAVMADDERRAEIEKALHLRETDPRVWSAMPDVERAAYNRGWLDATAAVMGRVRDARSDEAVPACVREYHAMLAGDVDFIRAQRAKARADIEAARSPQGEDHEADERALDTPLGARQRAQTQRDIADTLRFGSPQGEDREAGDSVFAHLDRAFLEDLYTRALHRITQLEDVSPALVVAELYVRENRVRGRDAVQDHALVRAALAKSEGETARPEQPPPDALGGQPPAEPPEAP